MSSSIWVNGSVSDALDGEGSNGKVVVLWKTVGGLSDNVTDIVGTSGNSGESGKYAINCELLNSGCSNGDELNVKIFGNSYVTSKETFLANSSGNDVNLFLNSPPTVTIVSPSNDYYENGSLNISCSSDDDDDDTLNISLYGNFSGSMGIVDSGTGNNVSFIFSSNEGVFSYFCSSYDGLVSKNTTSRKITVDKTSPRILSLGRNKSFSCGEESIYFNCSVSDNFSFKDVSLKVYSPSGEVFLEEMSNSFGGNYEKTFLINETGNYNFSCFAEDLAGNTNESFYSSFESYSDVQDLAISLSGINILDENLSEGKNVSFSVFFENLACVNTGSFFVNFYKDIEAEANKLFQKQFSFSAFENKTINSSFIAEIGGNSVLVFLDYFNDLTEFNESNNFAQNSISVFAWQEFYGKINATRRLASSLSDSIISWGDDAFFGGNVFMVDTESEIDWSALLPIGRDENLSETSNDFSEIDEYLEMTDFEDSVSNVFDSCSLKSFSINRRILNNVPVVQSTDNDNFKTGILWDSSDDSDGEFGGSDREDLVFVSEINRGKQGKYAICDYEIKVPARLRSYNNLESNFVYFYYELV